MSQQFNSYTSARQAAIDTSNQNPGIGYHISWIEDNCWEISIFADYESQDFFMNGQLFTPQDWDDE